MTMERRRRIRRNHARHHIHYDMCAATYAFRNYDGAAPPDRKQIIRHFWPFFHGLRNMTDV